MLEYSFTNRKRKADLMSVNPIFLLTERESKLLAAWKNLYTKKTTRADENKLKDFLEQYHIPFNILVKLAEWDNDLKTVCQSNSMSRYWDQKWKDFGTHLTPTKHIPYSGFRPQEKISSFNLVAGMVYFVKALKLIDKNGDAHEINLFLEKSAEYQCYFALATLFNLKEKQIKERLASSKQITEEDLSLDKFIKQVEQAPQGTPIFLLLVQIHLALARCYERLPKLNPDTIARTYWRAQIYWDVADLLELDSKVAIHNAYYGNKAEFLKLRDGFKNTLDAAANVIDKSDFYSAAYAEAVKIVNFSPLPTPTIHFGK